MRRIHSNKSASPVQETFESGDHEEIAPVEEPPARVSEPGSFESFKSPSTVWKVLTLLSALSHKVQTSITPAAFLAKQKSREVPATYNLPLICGSDGAPRCAGQPWRAPIQCSTETWSLCGGLLDGRG